MALSITNNSKWNGIMGEIPSIELGYVMQSWEYIVSSRGQPLVNQHTVTLVHDLHLREGCGQADLFIPHTIAFRGYSKRKSDGVEDI